MTINKLEEDRWQLTLQKFKGASTMKLPFYAFKYINMTLKHGSSKNTLHMKLPRTDNIWSS